MSLREKLERGVYRDKEGDGTGSGGGGGAADDDQTVQPGPGETKDSVADLNAKAADRGDDKPDDKSDDKADDKPDDKDDKKAADDKDADDKSDDKPDDKPDDKDDEITGIPKSRLDGALKRAREAEKELRELRNKPPEPAADKKAADDDDTLTIEQAEKRVEALDVEIAKAMKDDEDGSEAKLAVLLREQRELSEGIQEAKAEDQQSDNRAQTAEEIQFDRVVNELEDQIDLLNPDHKDYDEDIVGEVITLAQALNAQGRTQADSMLLAVDYMSGKLGIDKDTVKSVKKETDIEKNAKLAKDLPPDLSDAKGMASDKAGVTKDSGKVADMSDDEFSALAGDEERLSFLRGDTL